MIQQRFTENFTGGTPQFSDPYLTDNYLLGCGLYVSADGRTAQFFGQTSVDQKVDHDRSVRKTEQNLSDFVARAKRGEYNDR